MSELSNEMKKAIGILGSEMREIIVNDMVGFLKKRNQKNALFIEAALDGYVLALSRILELEVGWQYVNEVYKNESVPVKYYSLFNKKEKEEDDAISDETR